MMVLQENFKRVLLDCGHSSIHLHPAHLSLHPALGDTSTLLEPKYRT